VHPAAEDLLQLIGKGVVALVGHSYTKNLKSATDTGAQKSTMKNQINRDGQDIQE
jgi:hypothetical protein